MNRPVLHGHSYSFAGLIQMREQRCTMRNAIANASKTHIPPVIVFTIASEISQIINRTMPILSSHIAHPIYRSVMQRFVPSFAQGYRLSNAI
jgi:hypothetical protein